MIMSIQLLDFNKSNSSKSFMDDFNPTKEDQLTFSKLSEKHEEFLAKKEYDSQGITDKDIENETDDYIMAFGILELNYEYDIKENSGVPVNDDEYKTAFTDCGFTGFIDSITLNKSNSESFYYLFNVYNNLMCEVNLIDENFNGQTEESFKQLIKDKQQKSMPVVVQFVYYVNQ